MQAWFVLVIMEEKETGTQVEKETDTQMENEGSMILSMCCFLLISMYFDPCEIFFS